MTRGLIWCVVLLGLAWAVSWIATAVDRRRGEIGWDGLILRLVSIGFSIAAVVVAIAVYLGRV